MLIVMKHGAAPAEIERVVETIEEMGYQARPMPGAQRTAIGLVGNDGRVDATRLAALEGVREIIQVTQPYKQVSREWKPETTIVELPGGVKIGGNEVAVIAGPCSVESEQQIVETARLVRDHGATLLRGGAFKPRRRDSASRASSSSHSRATRWACPSSPKRSTRRASTSSRGTPT